MNLALKSSKNWSICAFHFLSLISSMHSSKNSPLWNCFSIPYTVLLIQ